MTHRHVQCADDGTRRLSARIERKAVIDGEGAGEADIVPKIERLSLDDDEECNDDKRIERRQGGDDETVNRVEVAVSESEKEAECQSKDEESGKKNDHRRALIHAFLRRSSCLM